MSTRSSNACARLWLPSSITGTGNTGDWINRWRERETLAGGTAVRRGNGNGRGAGVGAKDRDLRLSGHDESVALSAAEPGDRKSDRFQDQLAPVRRRGRCDPGDGLGRRAVGG